MFDSGKIVHLKNRIRFFFLMLFELIQGKIVKYQQGTLCSPSNQPGGQKEVLGLRPTETESAKFFMVVLTDIKNRGTGDILIVYIDGLTGVAVALKMFLPDIYIQQRIPAPLNNTYNNDRGEVTGNQFVILLMIMFFSLVKKRHLHSFLTE